MDFRVNSFLSLDVNLLACVVGVEWGRGKGERNKTGYEKAERRSSLGMPYTGNWSSHPKNVILPETGPGNPELIPLREHSQMFVYCLCLSLSLKVGVKRKRTTSYLYR